MPKPTHRIQGVEIFAAGKWNGDQYTMDDLQEMVKAFNENPTLKPYLKLGHDDNQLLIQQDGYPAAGWIERVYIKGEKLVADFCDIPQKIYDLIQQKSYRKVSSEIFWNLKIGDKVYSKVLAAVALLGADTPAVTSLNDILGMYKNQSGDLKIYTANIEFNIPEVSNKKKGEQMEQVEKLEKQVQEQQEKLAALEAEKAKYATIEKAKQEADAEIEELRKFKAAAEKKEQELLAEAEKARIEKFATELVTEKLATPAMKPLIEAIVGQEKKEYTINEKKMSKEELLKETLMLFKEASKVNFTESSADSKDAKAGELEKELDAKAKEYSAKHGVTYGQAFKIVKKEGVKK